MKDTSRRQFVKKSSSALLASSLAFNIVKADPTAAEINSETLKVGLIGCGGRGTGAALQATRSEDNVVLTAMCDIFEDRLRESHANLLKENPSKIKVSEDAMFLGFEGYKDVLASDVDVVILTTPPCFRPGHLAAAIEAGKHVFFEKPIAVDAPGVRSVIESAKKAKAKNLALMGGFCWRHDNPKNETYDRILDGAIGDVQAVYNTYNTGALWFHDRKSEWSDFQFQMRNWLYQTWMSGDHIAEQAVHSLDLMSWAFGDVLPVSATGTGGRQSRTEEQFGNVFDHFAVVFDYPNGGKGFHFSRQQAGCSRAYGVDMWGTKGRCNIHVSNIHHIMAKKEWKWKGDRNNMYQTEHDTLFKSIRDGNPFNDGIQTARSTMLAILGRMAAYTGQTITWEEALASNDTLGPDLNDYSWDLQWPMREVPKPGITKFA